MSEAPFKIGKFRIIEKIGKGSMSTVYRAYDPYMQRYVAIKVTDPNSLTDEKVRRRLVQFFFAEAQVYGMLDHRNILPVYDAGEDENRYYLVMEYIENSRTILNHCQPNNLLPVQTAVAILYQCCKGLQYAHSHNVLHLDIKPSNIMLTPDDRVKLADFGLAKIMHPDTDSLYLENLVGTPSHISPEQLLKKPVNPQADVYSLGVVMFSLLTGYRPFTSPDLKELLKKVLYSETPLLKEHRPDLPDALQAIVSRALAKDIKDRYAGAGDMAADLNSFHKKSIHAVVTSDIGMREKLDRLTRVPFFRDFFETELSEVVAAGEWLEYAEGQMILTEGDLDESFYVMVDGAVSVLVNGRFITALRTGDCFGEMAYVAKRTRDASIQAKTSVTVLKINKEVLEAISVYCQLKFSKVFLNTLIARLATHNGQR